MTQAAVDLATQVARLQAAGARNIVVYGLPDVGLTPAAAAQGAQATGTALANLFNTTLDSALASAGLQVIQVNTAQLLREIVANPASFGFTNVTMPVCTTASAMQLHARDAARPGGRAHVGVRRRHPSDDRTRADRRAGGRIDDRGAGAHRPARRSADRRRAGRVPRDRRAA